MEEYGDPWGPAPSKLLEILSHLSKYIFEDKTQEEEQVFEKD